MKFNINDAYSYVNDVIKLNPSVNDGMKKLLDYCRNHYESCAWDTIQNMDFKEDEQNIKEWLQDILENEPPCEEIDAFWFGLFDGIIDDEEEACILYFSGVNCIDDEDELDYEPVYIPDDRYSDSKILHDMSITLKNEGGKIAEIGEYILCLGYAALVINNIINTLDKRFLLELRIPGKVMVGFDSGDYIDLGTKNN